MRRGPKPKSTAQRRLEGNPGKRPLNAQEPAPPPVESDPGFDAPPAELGTDPVACAEWARLAPMLRRCRQITLAERACLIALCLEWSRYLTVIAKIGTLGMLVATPSGYPITSPYVSIANRAFLNCRALWAELGLTPSSRSRVKTDGAGVEGDDFSEFDAPPAPTTTRPH